MILQMRWTFILIPRNQELYSEVLKFVFNNCKYHILGYISSTELLNRLSYALCCAKGVRICKIAYS